jgi:glycosyltransferase involved in cell wall biosynthesis
METALTLANRLLREQRYPAAIELYKKARNEWPSLANRIDFNLEFASNRLFRGHAVRPHSKFGQSKPHSFQNEQKAAATQLGQYPVTSTHQLVQDQSNLQKWLSLGPDPYFVFESKEIFTTPQSWFIVEMNIGAAKQHLGKFYFDMGLGFNENNALSVNYQSAELISLVFYLEKVPKAIRFDPMEQMGEIEVNQFQFRQITFSEAKSKMLDRLIKVNEDFVGQSSLNVWKNIQEKSKKNQSDSWEYLANLYKNTFLKTKQEIAYDGWIKHIETSRFPTKSQLTKAIVQMQLRPIISVVMPVFNTPDVYLRSCIESVLNQSYINFELCIADDCSTKSHVRKTLEEYANNDARVKVVFRTKNGHISRASNSALEIACGEFVALLDHDDLLAEHALYCMALAINHSPNAQVLFSDEDKIDEFGKRYEPHFKSDWNPDLFFSQNYVSHLGVYKRDLLQAIGGFREGVEGSQDQDLLLRCLPHIKVGEIVHIPHVLYHWRALEGSTALESGEKSYTTEAGIKALRDYFDSQGLASVKVEANSVPNTYRIKWPIPQPEPMVSLLIPTRDRRDLVEVAVRSILKKTTYNNYEILILDNGSVESETLAFFNTVQNEDIRVRVIRYDHPFNYSAINNFGVEHAKGDLIGLINNDVEVINPDWLGEMVSHAVRPEIGCVGAKLYYSNDTIQHGGVILGIGGVANHSHKNTFRNFPGYFSRLVCTQNYSAVTAACLIVQRTIYEKVSGLDEVNLKVAFNDVDFCMKVREAGYRNLWTPYAELYHHESVSRGAEDTPMKLARFRSEVEFMKKKWGNKLTLDPYYNPNLTNDGEDFSLKINFA